MYFCYFWIKIVDKSKIRKLKLSAKYPEYLTIDNLEYYWLESKWYIFLSAFLDFFAVSWRKVQHYKGSALHLIYSTCMLKWPTMKDKIVEAIKTILHTKNRL